MREDTVRVVSSSSDRCNQVMCVHGRSKLLELFMFSNNQEAMERFRNRQRKFRKKATKYIDYYV